MLCTVILDTYTDAERVDVLAALRRLLTRHSRDWSRKGVYGFWDPVSRELLYVGLASNLPQRYAQHNGLVTHAGGNKLEQINRWFSARERLGFTIMIQGAAVQNLEDVKKLSPLIGAEARGITQIAEGQLIELCKQQTGRKPPWNKVGGSARGSGWAKQRPRSVISLLSAAGDDSLFVSRRSLRELVKDGQALQMEALLHAVRMHALAELHEMKFDYDNDETEIIKNIKNMLMLIDGKLVDDLTRSDEVILRWIKRFTDADTMASHRVKDLARMRDVAASSSDASDQAAAEFLAGFMELDADAYNARVATSILRTGYLREKPNLEA